MFVFARSFDCDGWGSRGIGGWGQVGPEISRFLLCLRTSRVRFSPLSKMVLASGATAMEVLRLDAMNDLPSVNCLTQLPYPSPDRVQAYPTLPICTPIPHPPPYPRIGSIYIPPPQYLGIAQNCLIVTRRYFWSKLLFDMLGAGWGTTRPDLRVPSEF